MNTKTLQLQPVFGPDGWRAMNAPIFRSDDSLRYYFRDHEARLLAEGAISKIAGRWFCVPDVMLRVVFQIGNELAAAEVAQ
jgi:hypothetical protein